MTQTPEQIARKKLRLAKRKLKAQKQMYRRRVRLGQCPLCGRPAVVGRVCQQHYKEKGIAVKKHAARRNAFTYASPKVWEVYGYGTTGALVYIGATDDMIRRALEERKRKHLPLGQWIDAHVKAGILPQPMTLDIRATKIEALAAEARLIQRYRAQGHPLLNAAMSETAIRRLERLAQAEAERRKKKLKEKTT